MGYSDTSTIVNKARTNNKFFINNFILTYKKLIDKEKLKNNKKEYLNLLSYLDKSMKDIDFNRNILFVCDSNISNEVFLTGFSKLEKLTTYYLCNLMQLHDIMFGNRTYDNPNIVEDDIMYSYQDIKETVLCVYIDKYMYPMQDDLTLSSLIVSREARKSELNKNLINWVFFKGSISALKSSDKLAKRVYYLYESNKWSIIDLNKLIKQYNSKLNPNSNNKKDNLNDIY